MAGGEGLAVICKRELSSQRLSAMITAVMITEILVTKAGPGWELSCVKFMGCGCPLLFRKV